MMLKFISNLVGLVSVFVVVLADDFSYDFTYEHGWRKYITNRWTEVANAQLGFRLIYLLAAQTDEKSACRNHSKAYLQAYESETLWAITMQDASAQSLEGILAGNTYHMGNFDECIDVSVALEPIPLQGQYCLLQLRFNLNHTFKRLTNNLRSQVFEVNATIDEFADSPFLKAWDRIKSSQDPSKYPRDNIYWAVCVPSSCTAAEIEKALQQELKLIDGETNINITGYIAPEFCQSKQGINNVPFSWGDLSFSILISSLTVLVCASTFLDWFQLRGTTSIWAKLLFCFSAKRNLKCLSSGDLAGTGFDAIHGLRLLFMILAIAGHRFMVNFGGPLSSVKLAEEAYSDPFNMYILNGMIVVDTFFVYSGCLTAYYLPLELNKRHMNPFLVWVYRIIRLTPVYLVVLLFHATLLENLGHGPLWPKIVGLEAKRCKTNWWTNLLYINNYVDAGNMCMFQTWYLAVDTHLFMIAVLIVYLMWKRPKIGYFVFTVAAFASIAVPFVITYVHEADAFLLLYKRAFEDPVASDYFKYMYAVSHIRGGPYIVGVATGFLLYKLRNTHLNIPQHFRYMGHVLSAAICLGAQYGGFVFYKPGSKYNVLEASAYNALHRAAWGVGIALNIFLLVKARIEWGHKMLTWAPLVPISRLTYCAYLLHTVTHLYEVGTLRLPKHASYYLGTWMFIGDIIVTFTLSLFLNLVVEAPFRAIEKSILGRKKDTSEVNTDRELTKAKIEKI